ncbi:MAG: hypothetical protein IME96_04065 [Proteobacteria bacterium]|nr:hypothetical protein [Pseudomonadota bacterium]
MSAADATPCTTAKGVPDSAAPPGVLYSLLRANVNSRAEIHKLCLQCHASNGAQWDVLQPPQGVQAPKVWSASVWTSDNPFNLIGAGGNFSTELNATWDVSSAPALGYGHSIGATNVLPPGGDQMITEFSCTNCHDPHGTSDPDSSTINMFRNLRVSATGAGANNTVQLRNYTHAPAIVNRGRTTGSYVALLVQAKPTARTLAALNWTMPLRLYGRFTQPSGVRLQVTPCKTVERQTTILA